MKRQAAYLQENAMSPFTRIAGEIDNPFNEFIKLTMEYGIGGLIILLILLYYVFHGNFNHTHSAVVFRGMLVGILVFAFFSYPFMYVQFQLLFVMCLAGILQIYGKPDGGEDAEAYRVDNNTCFSGSISHSEILLLFTAMGTLCWPDGFFGR